MKYGILISLGLWAIIFTVVAAVTGCASLQYSGVASYTVRPFEGKDGALVCCEVAVANGKEYASLQAHIEKRGADYTVDLAEQHVAAFKGQEIAAKAAGATAATAAKAATAIMVAPAVPAALGVLAR